jgi:type IV pilus assembly protein PilW
MPRSFNSGTRRFGQRGFSLIELLIAVLIALFLLGGLVTLVMGTRRTNGTQSALAQLQDNQRIAMTLLANVTEKAGYFPNPLTQQLSTFTGPYTLAGVTVASSQVLGGGTYNATTGDSFLVRFYAPPSDTNNTIIDCAGQSNAGTSSGVWYANVLAVGTVGTTSWLQCQTQTSGTGTILTVNLIPNVTKMTVLYGVSASLAGDDYSVVQYLNASQVTATNNWPNVTAVKVRLTFQVPAWGTTGGQMSSTTTEWFERVIPLMSHAGVDT